MPGVWPAPDQKVTKYAATTIAQPAPASAPSSECERGPPTSESIRPNVAAMMRKTSCAISASIASAMPRVAIPACGRALGTTEPAARRALGGIVDADGTAAQAGGSLLRERLRLAGECRPHGRARHGALEQAVEVGARDDLLGELGGEPAFERICQHPRERRAREHALGEVRRALALERAGDRPLEVGAREHLRDDPLDDAVLGERAADCLGQRARHDEVDGARGLGRGEGLGRRRLDAGTRALGRGRDAGADDWLAHCAPRHRTRGPQHEAAGRDAEAPGTDEDADDRPRPSVRRPFHPGSFTAQRRIRKLWTSCHKPVAVSDTCLTRV